VCISTKPFRIGGVGIGAGVGIGVGAGKIGVRPVEVGFPMGVFVFGTTVPPGLFPASPVRGVGVTGIGPLESVFVFVFAPTVARPMTTLWADARPRGSPLTLAIYHLPAAEL